MSTGERRSAARSVQATIGDSIDRGEHLVEIGVVACEIFVVGISQHVPWRDHECRSELRGSTSGPVLAVPSDHRAGPCEELSRRQHGQRGRLLRAGDPGSRPVLVEQDPERDLLILDEGLGVTLAACPDGRDPGSGCEDLIVPVADLTGPLTTCQSTEMTQEQDDLGLIGPHSAQPHLGSIRFDHHGVGQRNDIEHDRMVGTRPRAYPLTCQNSVGRKRRSWVLRAKRSVIPAT
jgi:hypothetical protein